MHRKSWEKIHQEEININNVISLIKKHLKSSQFYKNELEKEINFLSLHFHSKYQENEEEIKKLPTQIIERIICNENLELESEDELLNFIIQLYKEDQTKSRLFEYVYFNNVSVECVNTFIKIFDISDLTQGTWNSISKRLSESIKNLETKRKFVNKKNENVVEIKFSEKNKKGIFNYFLQKSNIQEEISITSSGRNSGDLNSIIQIDNTSDYYTDDKKNSWICFEFKKNKIIPTNYTIKSHSFDEFGCKPKSWVIERSINQSQWETLDKQNDCQFLNGKYFIHTFSIMKNEINEAYKFIRIRQTGTTWNGSNLLALSSIEFFGQII